MEQHLEIRRVECLVDAWIQEVKDQMDHLDTEEGIWDLEEELELEK